MNGKRRYVMVSHPLFDAPGKDGVENAKEYVEQLTEGVTLTIKEAREKNMPEQSLRELEKYFKSLKFMIRNIPDEIV